MKLKAWLREYKGMSYSEYKAQEFEKQWELEDEFKRYNRSEQIRRQREMDPNYRKATAEELQKLEEDAAKERKRYEQSLKAGGVDKDTGIYFRLHDRGDG